MKLSEAIRLGAMMKPQCSDGAMVSDDGTAVCAIGAGALAVGIAVANAPECYHAVRERFPVLGAAATHPLQGNEPRTVEGVIWNLNDSSGWTREQIADWVETVERAQVAKDGAATLVDSHLVGVGAENIGQ